MYFPVSGIDCHPLVPVLAAMGISFVTSMGGLSGAFLLLPFQMSFLGYTSPGVSATNHLFNVLACPGGIVRYAREGRLLWPLALTVAVGTLPGIVLGSLIRVYWLPDESRFKVFAGLLLLWIFWRMFRDLRRPAAPAPAQATLEAIERQAIAAALVRFGGNISQTAFALGVSRPTLYRKMSKYGLEE